MSRTEFTVTTINSANVKTGATFRVPGLGFTLTDIRNVIRHRDTNGVQEILCDVCGESVVDCPDIRPLLTEIPADWGVDESTDDEVDTLAPPVGARHVDGLVIFAG